MSTQRLDYSAMLQDAVRGVVRAALEEVAEQGMPGDHHFFIHFKTAHPEVSLPAFLRQRYPDEMSIILQHQYWGLMVDEESFSVSLAFDGARYTLTVPFAAVTAFADPAANLALQLGSAGAAAQKAEAAKLEAAKLEKKAGAAGSDAKKPAVEEPAAERSAAEKSAARDPQKTDTDTDGDRGGQVIDIDSFRKR